MTKHDIAKRLDQGLEEWHADEAEIRPLHEFLGITSYEYAIWVTDPVAAVDMIYARKYPQNP